MKRVSAGAHLPSPWLEPAKHQDDKADYCLDNRIQGFVNYGTQVCCYSYANQALVFMLHGLFSRWNKCLGYGLSSGATAASIIHGLLM